MNGHKNRSKLVDNETRYCEFCKRCYFLEKTQRIYGIATWTDNYCSAKCYTKAMGKKEKEIHLYELLITVRAGDINTIKGLLPHAVNAFLLNQSKIATYANDESNYSVYLTDHKERQGK